MEESPDFERLRAAGTLGSTRSATRCRASAPALARAFAISALGSITYYVGITYVPAFLTSVGSMGEADSLWLSTIAAIAVILVTPPSGCRPTASAASRADRAGACSARRCRFRCSR